MARIAIVTSGHLSTSPRVVREADALAAAGHDVVVTGVWLDAQQAEWDLALAANRNWSFVPAADLRGATARSRATRLRSRVEGRLARTRLALGLGAGRDAFGYAVRRLEAAARHARGDLVLLHLEPALAIGERLLRDGVRVSVDIEDWYSALRTSPGDAWARRELERLERAVFPAARSATTTSRALAAAIAARYVMPAPTVVYNGVSAADAPQASAPPSAPLRLLWFSQTVGPGRGLELLGSALRFVDGDWQLTVLGAADEPRRRWVRSLFAAGAVERLVFVPRVAPAELGRRVASHHVGLALETGDATNYGLTVTNKLCHYLQCGLAVAATDTAGQREVMEQVAGGGALVPVGDARALATALAPWIASPALALVDADRRRTAAAALLGAESQAPRIVAAVARALDAQ